MVFIGFLLLGIGVLLVYGAIRNLSVICLTTNALGGKSAKCTMT